MKGGRLIIEGNAGHFTGAAYSGETKGMLGGTIIVRGSCGREVGGRMRRGLVVVLGDSGEFAGAGMLAGSVFVAGRLGGRPGAGMKRGTIVAFGEAPAMLPTFHYACTYRPVFLQTHLRAIRSAGSLDETVLTADTFRRFVGDMNTGGRGEVLVRA
jgi:formylmethanofuran dehydrogenase subunit C